MLKMIYRLPRLIHDVVSDPNLPVSKSAIPSMLCCQALMIIILGAWAEL